MQYLQLCITLTLTHTHTHTHTVFCWGFFIHFLKKSTLNLKLVYGLPTLLLLYVFPLEAITAPSTVPAPTFSYGSITFGQRAALSMSSMHCIHRKTSYMILWSIAVRSLESLLLFFIACIQLLFVFVAKFNFNITCLPVFNLPNTAV